MFLVRREEFASSTSLGDLFWYGSRSQIAINQSILNCKISQRVMYYVNSLTVSPSVGSTYCEFFDLPLSTISLGPFTLRSEIVNIHRVWSSCSCVSVVDCSTCALSPKVHCTPKN